jgi:F5/8 type C domain
MRTNSRHSVARQNSTERRKHCKSIHPGRRRPKPRLVGYTAVSVVAFVALWPIALSQLTMPSASAQTNCSASTSGQTQLNESGFTASTADMPDASGAQNAITNAVNHSDPNRFTSGADQASGMTYEVNMGSAHTVDEVEMYVPDYAGDYPRGYNVEVSPTGTSWTTVASCTASAQPTIVSFSAASAQYLEVVLTAASTTNWWSIEQLLIYDN